MSRKNQLPSQNNNIQPDIITTTSIRASISSPYPPPDMLRQYDTVIPGAADRILKMAERQSEHRQFVEKSIVTSQEKRASKGQLFAFLISLFALASASFCAYFNQPWPASVIAGVSLSTIVTAFITGKNKQDKNADKQSKALRQADTA